MDRTGGQPGRRGTLPNVVRAVRRAELFGPSTELASARRRARSSAACRRGVRPTGWAPPAALPRRPERRAGAPCWRRGAAEKSACTRRLPCPYAPSATVICMMVRAARTATSGAALRHAQPHRAPRASRRLAGRRRRARAPALQPDASRTTAGTARRPRRFLLVQSASTPPPRRFVTAPLEEGASGRRRFARCYRGEPPPPRAAAASTATGTIFCGRELRELVGEGTRLVAPSAQGA